MPIMVAKTWHPILAADGWSYVDLVNTPDGTFETVNDGICMPSCQRTKLTKVGQVSGVATSGTLRLRGTVQSLLGLPNLTKPTKLKLTYQRKMSGFGGLFGASMQLTPVFRLQTLVTSMNLIAQATLTNNDPNVVETVGADETVPAALQEPTALAELCFLFNFVNESGAPITEIAILILASLSATLAYKIPF